MTDPLESPESEVIDWASTLLAFARQTAQEAASQASDPLQQASPVRIRPMWVAPPPMNLHAHLHKWTLCKNCGSDFEQRKSGRKRTCPSCRGIKPR
jgi:hypothetical protein